MSSTLKCCSVRENLQTDHPCTYLEYVFSVYRVQDAELSLWECDKLEMVGTGRECRASD